MEETLNIQNLHVSYRTDTGIVRAINGVDLSLGKGETLGIVGETGAGKTTLALSILKLLPKDVGSIDSGKIQFHETDLVAASERQMRKIRGEKISMIFQDPMSSLNPVITVGRQIYEALLLHKSDTMTRKDMNQAVDDLLEMVGIPAARRNEYPHQFSGGMKQRVVIAMALACESELLLADEPTTALDVTIQAQVLSMMNGLKNRFGTSMILITHDLGVVAQICDKVAIMYAGEIIESGTLEEIFTGTQHHPYTLGLFGSIPDLHKKTARLSPIEGMMPDPTNLSPGCKFHPRCPKCSQACQKERPELRKVAGSHCIRCHLFESQKQEQTTQKERGERE